MRKRSVLLVLAAVVCMAACGCGSSQGGGEKASAPETGSSAAVSEVGAEEVAPAAEEDIVKIVVSDNEKDPAVMYRVDFRTGKIETTVFADAPEKTERYYAKQEELKKFIGERIVPAYGADSDIESHTAEAEDEQKLLWNIKISYEGGEALILSSFTKYPDYWTDLVRLLEE